MSEGVIWGKKKGIYKQCEVKVKVSWVEKKEKERQ